MRVTAIDLSTNDQSVARVSLRLPDPRDRYLAKGIYGLDADEIVPKFYAFGQDGSKFNESSLKPRELVLRVVLNPNYVLNERHGDLRDELYKIISASREGIVKIGLRAGASSVAELLGQVIKFEAPLTTKIPEVQLTLKCEDPLPRGITEVRLDSLDLGTSQPFKVTDALSTAPHGGYFELTLTADMDDISIQDKASDPTWLFKLDPDGGFLNGDIIKISSQYKNKYVLVERAATDIPFADAIVPGSLWPIIFPGLNEYYVTQTDFTWNEINYRSAYWGV